MEEFFKSTKFKILAAVFVVLFSFMIRAAYTGGAAPLTSQVVSIVTSPFRSVAAKISDSATRVFHKYIEADQVLEENEQLKERIRILNQQLVDYEKYKQENEQLREYLELKEEHPDYVFEYASVIGRGSSERFYSFTIDKGSLAGIKQRDPVITADGLVGMVTEVGLNYAKVLTVYDIALDIGAYNVSTGDIGIVSGKVELALEGYCQFSLVDRSSTMAEGNLVYTSGYGGIYPKGIAIGEVIGTEIENHGMSLYAVIKPIVDIENVKSVQVITSFSGQGEMADDPEMGSEDLE